jgi:ATPase subunit of ABC transporter with duplicated ATPase domains
VQLIDFLKMWVNKWLSGLIVLRQYPGCLIVVSHDEVFLGNLELQQRLEFNPEGWVRKAFIQPFENDR